MIEKIVNMLIEEQDGQPYVKRFFHRMGNEIVLFLPLAILNNEAVTPYVKHRVFEQDLDWDKSLLTGADLYYKIQDIGQMLKVTIKLDREGGISQLRIKQLSYNNVVGNKLYLKEVPMVVPPEVRESVMSIIGYSK